MEEEDKELTLECANTSQFRENWAEVLRSEPQEVWGNTLGTRNLYVPLPGCQDLSKGKQNKAKQKKAKLPRPEIFQGSKLKK